MGRLGPAPAADTQANRRTKRKRGSLKTSPPESRARRSRASQDPKSRAVAGQREADRTAQFSPVSSYPNPSVSVAVAASTGAVPASFVNYPAWPPVLDISAEQYASQSSNVVDWQGHPTYEGWSLDLDYASHERYDCPASIGSLHHPSSVPPYVGRDENIDLDAPRLKPGTTLGYPTATHPVGLADNPPPYTEGTAPRSGLPDDHKLPVHGHSAPSAFSSIHLGFQEHTIAGAASSIPRENYFCSGEHQLNNYGTYKAGSFHSQNILTTELPANTFSYPFDLYSTKEEPGPPPFVQSSQEQVQVPQAPPFTIGPDNIPRCPRCPHHPPLPPPLPQQTQTPLNTPVWPQSYQTGIYDHNVASFVGIVPYGYNAMGGGEVHPSWPAEQQTVAHSSTFHKGEDSDDVLLNLPPQRQLLVGPVGTELLGPTSFGPAVQRELPVRLHPQAGGAGVHEVVPIHEESEDEGFQFVDMEESSDSKSFEGTSGQAGGIVNVRSRFSEEKRKQTAETRRLKACVRCRIQHLRCGEPDSVTGECDSCKRMIMHSKKTIHRVGCFRLKLTQAVLFRQGGLGLTKRWRGTDMRDVKDRVIPSAIRTIHVTDGFCLKPMIVEVVQYTPNASDATARVWTVMEDGIETRKSLELSRYCLADIHKTADYWEKYMLDNAVVSMLRQRSGPVITETPEGHQLPHLDPIQRTYLMVVKHYSELKEKCGRSRAASLEFSLMSKLIVLWFSMRHTTGSTWICGEDTLDMEPPADEFYPLRGRVSLPRMVTAQFDSINHSKVLAKYGKMVLRELESMINRNGNQFWWTIYLSMFVLLREASWITSDRYRHARNNHGSQLRYTLPDFVENLHESCNNLLVHWHYYHCERWLDLVNPSSRDKSGSPPLTTEQFALVMDTMRHKEVQRQLEFWRRYKEENGALRYPGTYDPEPVPLPQADPLPENKPKENRKGKGKEKEKATIQSAKGKAKAQPTKHEQQPWESRGALPSETPATQPPPSTDYAGGQKSIEWDHGYYWISQLFERNWGPHPIYQREYA